MIRQSDSIAKLAPALVAAQAEMVNAPKETKGQVGSQIRYYTDLPTLTDLVRPILAKHALAYLQLPSGGAGGQVGLTTRLLHDSGEWIEDDYTMPAGQGAQGVGSALTYARRYALMALLGIAADDDDGAAASQGQSRRRQPAAQVNTNATGANTPTSDRAITPAQLTKLGASFTDNGIRDRSARLAYVEHVVGHPIESSKDLTASEAGAVIDALDDRLRSLPTGDDAA